MLAQLCSVLRVAPLIPALRSNLAAVMYEDGEERKMLYSVWDANSKKGLPLQGSL